VLWHLGEIFTELSLKQLPRVLEVGFGVGAGAGQTLEGFVQNRNNPLLFFEWREGNSLISHLLVGYSRIASPRLQILHRIHEIRAKERVHQKTGVKSGFRP